MSPTTLSNHPNHPRDPDNLNQGDKIQPATTAQSSSSKEKKAESHLKSTVPGFTSDLVMYQTTLAFKEYQPRFTRATIDSSNYGDRYSTDVDGNLLDNSPLVVLHETTDSVASAINTFRTPHYHDSAQVSYHALIALDGTIINLVPSDRRAFGAGNSVFEGAKGMETVKTNPNLPSSVNNFAYHISLETPPDGRSQPNRSYHSGYTDSQYKSLAWLLALSNIPEHRITTHKNVDRSGQKIDPRSFDFDKFLTILHTYRQPIVPEISTPTN
ncbi:N-acetylmuramoyl-L-alanine amidase [Pleurocapsales cyanobacterium LEGE 10410]|nr:N-acetylmuramoyl-L-alanine amidase [Pleurocapsales cyanobacterium LEGE 10410]